MYYKCKVLKNKKSKYRLFFFSTIGMIIISILLIAFYVYNTFFHTNTQFDSIIADVSKRYALDPMLIKAVIWRESNFNPNAVGSKGEIGLMQLMFNSSVKDWTNYTKREITDRGILFNPKLNIEIGTWYLACSRKRWLTYNDNIVLALAGYNAGYSNVKKWVPKNYQGTNAIEFIKFPSTKKYVKSILDKYHSYQQKDI
jgi:soluble lytic murein transglycosylase